MTVPNTQAGAARNVAIFPWFKFCQNLVFWQAVWFLYFQNELSAAEAILLYAVYDIGTTVLEVPSGYMSDRLGRRITLVLSAFTGIAGAGLLAFGQSFEVFALGQVLLGASAAFASGTDSALLYESLAATGRARDVEGHELRAWRFSFVALAVSAVAGGGLALYSQALPFLAGSAAFAGVLIITLRFTEPPRSPVDFAQGGEFVRLASLRTALSVPVLRWLFALSVLMYVFSHIPFVFGQPFILEALDNTGFESQAPIVSGLVSALMMIVSVITSLFALKLRRFMGLPVILLVAFTMQIALSGVLALTNEAIAIAFLFLRMVPNSLSRPFVLARIQPLLSDESRATYLSLQSFFARLFFAGSLLVASLATGAEEQMVYSEIQRVLTWYVAIGLFCLLGLILAARRTKIESDTT